MQLAPINLELPEEQLSPAAKRLREVHQEILARRNVKPPEYTPPPRPAALIEQTRLEQEEGARRVAMAKAQREAVRIPKPVAPEAVTEPVYRPGNHVPGMGLNGVAVDGENRGVTHVSTRTFKSL